MARFLRAFCHHGGSVSCSASQAPLPPFFAQVDINAHYFLSFMTMGGGKTDDGTLIQPAHQKSNLLLFDEHVGWVARSTPSWFLSSHDIDLVCWYFETDPIEVYANTIYKVLV
jgi:hypothetical protein